MDIKPGSLLAQVNAPADLKKLHKDQLPQLTDELRQYIIDVVSVYGGHFGASLGVVELSVALHFVFNTPYDQLVWDVGHQAYGHKILTGRRDNFASNRKYFNNCWCEGNLQIKFLFWFTFNGWLRNGYRCVKISCKS